MIIKIKLMQRNTLFQRKIK